MCVWGARLGCSRGAPEPNREDQDASAAEAHFQVEKSPGDPTVTAVRRLREGEVVDEIARMLGGDQDDEEARRHAAAMLG